jgi:hypothetical protein
MDGTVYVGSDDYNVYALTDTTSTTEPTDSPAEPTAPPAESTAATVDTGGNQGTLPLPAIVLGGVGAWWYNSRRDDSGTDAGDGGSERLTEDVEAIREEFAEIETLIDAGDLEDARITAPDADAQLSVYLFPDLAELVDLMRRLDGAG